MIKFLKDIFHRNEKSFTVEYGSKVPTDEETEAPELYWPVPPKLDEEE